MRNQELKQKQLEAQITKIATPIIKKIARDIAQQESYRYGGFRVKKTTATPQSSTEQRVYRGLPNSGVGLVTVTGSKSAPNGGGEIPALNHLITILADLNIIIDDTST